MVCKVSTRFLKAGLALKPLPSVSRPDPPLIITKTGHPVVPLIYYVLCYRIAAYVSSGRSIRRRLPKCQALCPQASNKIMTREQYEEEYERELDTVREGIGCLTFLFLIILIILIFKVIL